MLFEFFIIFGSVTTKKFVQIHINTSIYVYYKFIQLTLELEYSTILILHKT
jgi:hypothetical protein